MTATPATLEEKLVLECSCINLDSARAERIRNAIETGPDWNRVAELAERHRVTPLVCSTLKRIAPEILAGPGASVLVMRARFIAARSLQLTRELLSLLGLLKSNGIATIPLKGPVLAMEVFGNLSSREFADLDVLVHPRDLDQACLLLEREGYKSEYELDSRQRTSYIGREHAFTYFRQQDELTVELHWRLHDHYLSFPLSTRDIWNGLDTGSLFGTPISKLKPEQHFVFLCMHGAKHSWERLEWIVSLRGLAGLQSKERWPLILAEAARLRSTRLVQLGLTLADNLSSGPATQLALALLAPDPIVDELAGTVWEQMFAEEVRGSAREVYRFRFYLKAREWLWDRLRVVWSASVRIPHPNSSKWDRTSLPPSLFFLHYILSPLGFFAKFGPKGLRGILWPERKLRGESDWWQKDLGSRSEKKTAGCNVNN